MDTLRKSVCRIRRRNTFRLVVDVVIWFSEDLVLEKKKRERKILIPVKFIILVTVAIPLLLLFLHGTPYERGVFCDDEALSYPYNPDALSTSLLLVAGFTVSIIVVVITEVLNCMDLKCRQQCAYCQDAMYFVKNYAIFLVGFILQQLTVEIVKNKTGILRPNFLEVCRPQFNRTSCPGYITNYTCTGNNLKEIRESRLSFPSGHSSFAMYIAAYFCLYIENRLQIGFSSILKVFLQSGLILIALLCGLDRVLDNKHHPSDVIAGFILGAAVAILVHHKIGKSAFKCTNPRNSAKLTLKTKKKSCYCWTCEKQTQELETQTPSPLLQNDYSESNGNNTPTMLLVKDTPFYVRRHFSTPITPTKPSEDIV